MTHKNDWWPGFLIRTGMSENDAPVPRPVAPVEIPNAITILHRSATQAAPEAVAFSLDLDALGIFGLSGPGAGEIYDPRLHDLVCFWSFGDDYPYRAPENLPGMFKLSGEALGPVVGHVYRAPGHYRLRVDIYGTVAGKLIHGFSEAEITVKDPDAIFDGNRTLFVSPSSDWSHAPEGALQYTSLDRACDNANTSRRGGLYRIMLNRGEVYDFGGIRFGFNTQRAPTLHIVAGAGEGANPVINCTGGFSALANYDEDYRNKDLVFQNLTLMGALDSTAGDYPANFPDAVTCMEISPQLLLLDGCEISGFALGLYLHDADRTGHRGAYVNDCVLTNYGQWGVLGGSFTVFAAMGSRITSAVDAVVDNGSNGGGTLRLGGAARFTLIQNCDIFCRQGWSPHGDYIATQPCARLNSDGFEGAVVNVSRSSFEGGMVVISISATDTDSHASNVIVDSCYLVGSYQTSELIVTTIGGVTIRNNIMVMPRTERLASTNGPHAFVRINARGKDALNLASPIRVFSNTMVNRHPLPMMEVVVDGGFTDITTGSNALLHHGRDGDDTAFAHTAELWTPRERGYRSSTVPLHPGTASPAGTVASYEVTTKALGMVEASGPVALFDFSGGLRGDHPVHGAH